MALSSWRRTRISGSESSRTSCGRKRISPETIFPGGSGINRMSERFATDLPEPDSPTIPSVSPRLSSKLMPSTAFTTPSSVSKYVRRTLTSSRFPLVLLVTCHLSLFPHLRIERIAQAIAQKIQREQHHRHRQSRENQLPWKNRQRLRAVRRQTPPGHARRPHPKPEE